MVKVIKYGKIPETRNAKYKLTCTICSTIFICDSNDLTTKTVADMYRIPISADPFPNRSLITCPQCNTLIDVLKRYEISDEEYKKILLSN